MTGGWSELFSGHYLASVLVLAGGVALYAMNLYFTAALMPSIVADIGGARYYAWVATGFLMAAVIAAMLVSRVLGRWGAAAAYLAGFLVFSLGAAINALSPTMELLVVGRVVQGLGGGLLAGLGFAVIRSTLPQHLWARGAGLVSAMWGVGTLVGPALGGLFAELGAWRWAYGLLLAVALLLAALTRRTLPRAAESTDRSRVPVAALVTLTLAASAFSLSSTVPEGISTTIALVAGVLLIAAFLSIDARGAVSVLPRSTYARGNSLKWVYLTVAALCAGVMTENFVPLFGQRLGGLSPLVAGLLGAALSVGWVVAQLFSVGLTAPAARRAIRIAPLLLTGGLLAYGLLQADAAPGVVVIAWAVVLFVAGTGIGLAFPHLSVAAMSSTDDPAEGAQAAAALNTTQLITYAVTSAIAGTLIRLGDASVVDSARLMALGIAVLTAFGVATAVLATRTR
ncbi:Probable multidrug-efflux transporter Rv1634/MT1670 [Nocardia otitidiscaviarum]|uniref:Probable multidrug-efflux transporter Rv1634/MT1670 n=1 Tax=Nocardia otitidiscaviarum TaxID=1823 RepID=A0A379JHF2_9NOCA|nr:Probable multidrug-efflux transporter Rv1634/MT1670 [Nocardia otitidiscaviarum]